MADRAQLLADLAAESEALDAVLGQLEDVAWLTLTPAAGWTIAHQVAHLSWTDERALAAATDPAGFLAAVPRAGLDRLVEETAAAGMASGPTALLARWRRGRVALAEALVALPDDARLPWYGPPMAPASMATARLMETWAHGLDVTDALGLPISVSPRLRAVCHLGVRTRDFAFVARGLPAPAEPFRIELTGPDGALWTWGPAEAAQRVTGPALDFCLRVTRRRHRADLALAATGPDAERWLDVAQAFAGPAGADRAAMGGPA